MVKRNFLYWFNHTLLNEWFLEIFKNSSTLKLKTWQIEFLSPWKFKLFEFIKNPFEMIVISDLFNTTEFHSDEIFTLSNYNKIWLLLLQNKKIQHLFSHSHQFQKEIGVFCFFLNNFLIFISASWNKTVAQNSTKR